MIHTYRWACRGILSTWTTWGMPDFENSRCSLLQYVAAASDVDPWCPIQVSKLVGPAKGFRRLLVEFVV